ncbi:uncharacterized protein L3040_001412 [Drepanopeziza brunnea f. sp. 'multigermtubi']|uniref:Uncharacterized protein n=1 Tax=Marssonina brunnea f. sp. multigermtubi (strain MB_m1) TaxID=1072389 RepID=K1X7T4_MARBU|nr:uncharacterized protein MBM_05142 [Drepanopeziza brunnea f. sp. 'multigermtubi' MB_m1]EKD16673.1 hypothetical protein MBM_05142 [Drepanopeziza brunnea f. sp. 'multigermtubi' MB_m1]KAJ5051637.1 hypothetical protein L3040_001412 [Drepanopeziza brunnea f. sp. 'multigermtubi']
MSVAALDKKTVTVDHVPRPALGGSILHRVKTDCVSNGWIGVDVRIQELDCTYMTTLIAGSVGMEFEASGDHGEALDTVKSLSGWWAYMKAEDSKSCEKDQLEAETKPEGDQIGAVTDPALVLESRKRMWADMAARLEYQRCALFGEMVSISR